MTCIKNLREELKIKFKILVLGIAIVVALDYTVHTALYSVVSREIQFLCSFIFFYIYWNGMYATVYISHNYTFSVYIFHAQKCIREVITGGSVHCNKEYTWHEWQGLFLLSQSEEMSWADYHPPGDGYPDPRTRVLTRGSTVAENKMAAIQSRPTDNLGRIVSYCKLLT
jgi:hypothetical protein